MTADAMNKQMMDDVAQFMTTFQQPFPAGNPKRMQWLEEEVHKLVEAQFKPDVVDRLTHTVDAIVDFLYIAAGAALESGKTMDEIIVHVTPHTVALFVVKTLVMVELETNKDILENAWNAVHAANMRKLWNSLDLCTHPPASHYRVVQVDDNRFAVLSDSKVIKPPGWVGPEEEIRKLVTAAKGVLL